MTKRHPGEGRDPSSCSNADRDPGRRRDHEFGLEMSGDNCRAEPFTESHRDALRAACAEDREIWAIYSINFGPEGFDAAIDGLTTSPRNRTFVLFDSDELAGMSSFLGIDQGRQTLEIGGTYYRPKFRGTGFNRRVKDMMLERAFSSSFRRVEFRVDARNARSQAAMKKLGAVREGVLRADRITWNGHVRDTVLFAILKDEWPV
jgi:RimJ/RimL family protein N-acetyltransferase